MFKLENHLTPDHLTATNDYFTQQNPKQAYNQGASDGRRNVKHINVLQNEGLMKRENRVHSVFAGSKPTTVPMAHSSALAERKSSINAHRDTSTSVVRKKYQMSKTSTQKELLITKKDIKFVTVNMLNMNLTTINLSFNKILYIPDEVCSLHNLASLRIDHNNIKHLPENLGQLANLKYLACSYNDLRSLPDSISGCKSLVELQINDNKVEVLPPGIGRCVMLETLQLHANKISMLPASLGQLAKLETVSLEWFQYFEPPQQLQQTAAKGKFVIDKLKEFCNCTIKLFNFTEYIGSESPVLPNEKRPQRSFVEFLCYFYICKKLKTDVLFPELVVSKLNDLKYLQKERSLPLAICSNKHPHLLQQIVKSKHDCPLAKVLNRNINLNNFDLMQISPLIGALRQQSSEYARILMSSESTCQLDVNLHAGEHGYPLHYAIMSEKFDIALALVSSREIDPHVLNTIGANMVHLLFVKYDKEATLAYEILKRSIELGVDMNLVDSIGAAPIHIALRKKQYQAIRDMVLINQQHKSQVFDLNIKDKKGYTPLHYAVQNHDYQMFFELMQDEHIDPNIVDAQEFQKARKLSVIFSAFHKILYKKERRCMQRQFVRDQAAIGAESNTVNLLSCLRPTLMIDSIGTKKIQAPISVSNKAKKNIDLAALENFEHTMKRSKSPQLVQMLDSQATSLIKVLRSPKK